MKVSNLVADSDPFLSQVVSPSEDLQVVAVGHQLVDILIDFFGLLTLPSPIAENDILSHSPSNFGSHVALDADEAGLLGVLEVIAVSLGNFAVDGLLDPGDGIY